MNIPGTDTQPQRFSSRYLTLLLFSFCLFLLTPVTAHEVRPAVIDLQLEDEQQYQLTIKLNLEALLAGVGQEHDDTDDSAQAGAYNQLRQLTPQQLEQRWQESAATFTSDLTLNADGVRQQPEFSSISIPEVGDTNLARDSAITFNGQLPAGAGKLDWSWPERYGTHVLRISTPQQEDFHTAFLNAGTASDAIMLNGTNGSAATSSLWSIFSDYVVIGFEHIIPKGLDHILFVIGLFLLSASFGALLWQVTSFTLAHSVTLALGMLGWVQISPSIVEPLIAASIIYVCLENVFSEQLSRWRPVVIFAFGLLHGLGFASVLTEIGLAPEHFALGLLAFNIGVELGQLSVIFLCFLLVGFWFRKRSWYRKAITIPASLVIAGIGLYWLLERTVWA
ncbi:MAG: HupE/UreJ family protein [Thiolinea sp.]